jgi:alpha-ketoglutarate-dependent taurine dioxygenase
MWDNFSTQHLAMHDYELPRRRRMQRTTVKGSVPQYVAA